MSADEADELIHSTPGLYFDYIGVKCLKVDLSDDYEFDSRLYDRENGSFSAESAIAPLRRMYAACANKKNGTVKAISTGGEMKRHVYSPYRRKADAPEL